MLSAPFDRVVRLDKRLLFFRPAQAEYLTIDKKNLVVESLATWRIADPEHFLRAFTSQAAAEQRARRRHSGGDRLRHRALSGVRSRLARSGGEPAIRPIVSAIGRSVADFSRTAYGIDVISLDIRRLSPAGAEPGSRLRSHEGRTSQDRQGKSLRGRTGGQGNNRRGRP